MTDFDRMVILREVEKRINAHNENVFVDPDY